MLTFGGVKEEGSWGEWRSPSKTPPEEWEKRRPTPGPRWSALQQLSKEESKRARFLELITRKKRSVRSLSSYQPKAVPRLSPGYPNKCGLSCPWPQTLPTAAHPHAPGCTSGGQSSRDTPHPARWVFCLSCGTSRTGDPSWPSSSLWEPYLKPEQIRAFRLLKDLHGFLLLPTFASLPSSTAHSSLAWLSFAASCPRGPATELCVIGQTHLPL